MPRTKTPNKAQIIRLKSGSLGLLKRAIYDENIEKYTPEALNKILEQFYATVRK